ncbi:MAG TPA: glutathione S-transferase family protein [Nostocaceae cyanobacterium]|nr:glutathione S-transferase family protein [Nostocaceae cyanobacterium]
MITLYTTQPFWGLASPSPACMKLETWLRMAKIDYQIDPSANLAIAPKGKVPFIAYQGQLIGDSTLIIEMFKSQEGIDLDADLTAYEKAISVAFRRMIKENIYWGCGYVRYGVEENWQIYREALISMIKDSVPIEQCDLMVEGFYKIFQEQIHAHGLGRHNDQEITQIMMADFQSLSDFLGDKPFFMGDKPTTLDATAYAYIANTIKPPFKHPIIDFVLNLDNLCQHSDRMTQEFFSELA